MEIVINIDDELYEKVRNAHKGIFIDIYKMMVKAILHGTQLPKGHGKLIDANQLQLSMFEENWTGRLNERELAFFNTQINKAPTIIESDQESED